MSRLGLLMILLVSSPLLVFAAHAVVYRALARAGARPTAHSSALLALVAAFVPLCLAAWRVGVFDSAQDPMTRLCALVYMAAVYGALGVLYIDVVNVAETSLHMHLLLELAWGGAVPLSDLLERYSAEKMIAARLERLTSLGQLRVLDGRCYVGNRSTLYLAAAIDAWRVVLGLPTRPPETAAGPSAGGLHGRPR